MNEVSSRSTSLLDCEGANVNVVNSLAQAQVDSSHGPSSRHYDQTKDFSETSSWVLDRIIFYTMVWRLLLKAE